MSTNRIFAVFGLGTFGRTIAEVLVNKGASVIAVDNNQEQIDYFSNKVTSALLLNTTDEKAMAKAPLDDIDTAIVAMGEDIEVSIITTALLKRRGIPYIVARAVTDIHAQILKQIGANEVINLQEEGGIRLAQKLIAPEVLDTVPISSDFSIAEVDISKAFEGKTISDLALQEKFNLRLVVIRRTKIQLDTEGNPLREEEIIFPTQSEKIKDSDVLILVGKNNDINELKSVL